MIKPRDNFIIALEGGQPVGRVPHFELVFLLTMEALGRVHPMHRHFAQWHQMSNNEKRFQLLDIADVYVATARKYEHSAIFVHNQGVCDFDRNDQTMQILENIRQLSGRDYFIMMHGDATYAIPNGERLIQFIMEMADRPQKVKDTAKKNVEIALNNAERFRTHGLLDGFALCSDYCFNTGPFLSPVMFDEFITPYLVELIAGYRSMGFYVIKHTDGNILPILDSLVAANPHALHSIDPQGGVDIADIKRRVGKKVCLIGNVNCGLLDTGTDQEVAESVRYALKYGMPGGGYIFSTSNCIYTGMDIKRYELMLNIWRQEGNYE